MDDNRDVHQPLHARDQLIDQYDPLHLSQRSLQKTLYGTRWGHRQVDLLLQEQGEGIRKFITKLHIAQRGRN